MKSVPGEQPRNLRWIDGRWVLELEVMLPIGDTILRPTLRAVEGAESIAYYLDRLDDAKGLADGARELMEQPAPAVETSYQAHAGGWISTPPGVFKFQEELDELRRTMSRTSADRSPVQSKLREIQEQLATSSPGGASVRSDQLDEIERRLSRLEQQARSSALSSGAPAAQTDQPRQAIDAAPTADDAADAANQQPQAVGAPDPDQAADGPDPRPSADEAPDGQPAADEAPDGQPAADEAPDGQPAADEAPAASAAKIKTLPPEVAIEELLERLLGENTTLRNATEKEDVNLKSASHTRLFHYCQVVDDDGEVVGAIITDWRASILLSGMMLKMPRESLEEMIRSNKPEEEVIETLTEVFNNIGSLINKLDDNDHVRCLEARAFSFGEEEWTGDPAVRVDLIDEELNCRIIMLTR